MNEVDGSVGVGHGRRADFLPTVFRRISYENMGQNRVFVALK